MKRKIFFAAVVLSLIGLSVLGARAASANLIVNPDLEVSDSGGFPVDWIRGRWGTNSVTFTYPVTGSGGGKAAKVAISQHTSGDAKWVPKEVAVTPGTLYDFSDMYVSNVNSYLTLEIKLSNGSLLYTDIASVGPQTTFTAATARFTAPANAVSVRVFHLIKQVGNLTVDKYDLHEAAGPTPTPTPTPTASVTPTPTPTPTVSGQTYTVVQGDSLYLIGKKLGIPWQNIAEWNNIVSPYTILSGQVLCVSASCAVTVTGFPHGLVSIDFDDGNRDMYDIAMPIINAAGFKTTQYIVSGYFGFPAYITEDEMLTLQGQGHEIGGHTRTHANVTTLSESAARAEIGGGRSDLRSIGANPVNFFAYPFGAYNSTVIQYVKDAGFLGARTTDGGYNFKNQDIYILKRQNLTNTTTFSQVKTWIDTAMAEKTWLILVAHHVNNSGQQYTISPALLQQIVDYLEQKSITPITMTEGLTLMNN